MHRDLRNFEDTKFGELNFTPSFSSIVMFVNDQIKNRDSSANATAASAKRESFARE